MPSIGQILAIDIVFLVVEPDGQFTLVLVERRGPAAFLPARSCCGETCLGPLTDQIAFELRDRSTP